LFAGPGQVTGAKEGEPPAVSVGGGRPAGVARRRNPVQGVLGRPAGLAATTARPHRPALPAAISPAAHAI